MIEKLIQIASRILVVMFFTGLLGCGLMIVVSWFQIFSDLFNPDDEE